MAQRIFHESGQDGRSVLGMLAVQVERDPKTGATVIRSVSPVSSPAGAPRATAVFDDGRKSIHTVGRSVGQPSTEELDQILTAIDGVGMKVLLDEVKPTPNKAEMKAEIVEEDPMENLLSVTTVSREDNVQLDSFSSDHLGAEMRIEKCDVSIGSMGDTTAMSVGDVTESVDDMVENGPVTLMFLGYTDGDQGQSHDEDHGGMITVERVIITEDGEEHVLGPETSASLRSSTNQISEQEAGKWPPDEAFQDVPLDGNGAGVKVPGEDGDKGMHNSTSPSKAEGEGTSKRKTCQCCSVM